MNTGHRIELVHKLDAQGVDDDFIAERLGITVVNVRKLRAKAIRQPPKCDRCEKEVPYYRAVILQNTIFCGGCHRKLWKDPIAAADEYPGIF